MIHVVASASKTPPRAPAMDADVDLDAHLAVVPSRGTCKGMFALDVVRKVETLRASADIFATAGVPRRAIRMFADVPYGQFLRLIHAGAGILYPDVPRGEALRRVGQAGYDAFVDSQIGRVLLGAAGRNFGRVARLGSRAYQVSTNLGSVTWTDISDNSGYYRFEGLPGFIETYQVGIVEGAMMATGTEGEVTVRIESLHTGEIHISWS